MIESGKFNFTEDCDRVAEILRRVGEKWRQDRSRHRQVSSETGSPQCLFRIAVGSVLEHGAHDIRLSTLDQIGKFLWRQMRRSIDPLLGARSRERIESCEPTRRPIQSRARLSAQQSATCF